ncbi:MAG: nuclear transport factor 2 family protein [Acidimicrobiales bacterium]
MNANPTEINRAAVRATFEQYVQGNREPFLALVSPDVRWTVIGSTPISGTYASLEDFNERASKAIRGQLAKPLVGSVVDVHADGDHVILQWKSSSEAKNGTAYEQSYCWVMRFEDARVVETTAYLDTELVSAILA